MSFLFVFLLAQSVGAGELTHSGNRWAWSRNGDVSVFVPQLVMYATPPSFYGNPGKVDADIRLFLEEHGFNGFHVFVSCRWFDIGEPDCREVEGEDPEVDPRTFEALEMLIRKTHAKGGMVHLWMWGDEERGQTPSARDDWGGLDGPVARKVERAIAQRLGPLPGWSLGYGFDLDEWVEAEELHAWRDRLQGLLPRFHFLGGRPQGPNDGRSHARYRRWNGGLDYASYEHHKPSYTTYVDALEASPDKPVLSEDRFRVLESSDPKHYTPEEVRRGLWHSTLAGGVGNIWGYLLEGGSHELGSAPFPNREAIRTYFDFFRGRFLEDMTPCSGRRAKPHRRTLCLGSGRHYVFYKEATDTVGLDLRDLEGEPAAAVAVDTRKPYAELALGRFALGKHEWKAPYRSDWAVAVGRFETGRSAGRGPSVSLEAPSDLTVGSSSRAAIRITWRGRGDDEERFEVERAAANGAVPGKFERVAVVPPDVTSYTDVGIEPSTTYWYRVRAFAPSGASSYTPAVRAYAGDRTGVVAEVSPSSYQWAPLRVGLRYYLDRSYTVAAYPQTLEGALLLRTANDDKERTAGRFISFTVAEDVTLLVGFDRRAERVPYWLDEWEPAGGRIEVEGDAMRYFELYRREVPRGEVSLGGNSAAGADWGNEGRSQYIVLIVAK